LEKEMSDRLITEAAKIIFTYCRVRTGSKEDAEDLSQDILVELLKTRDSLRDDKAFYGFMWAVACNVYKNWCKKHRRFTEAKLDENIEDKSVRFVERFEREEDIGLLYRELGLLGKQYREATVLYYFDGLKVSEISKTLGITQSMVKFLLFKSRKILKEGMNMEKTRGNLSFNPSGLVISIRHSIGNFNPEGAHSIWALCEDNLLAQNILLACYNDRCTVEEISLQTGVAVPYLERDLKKLCEKELLIHRSGKYETAIVIFTKEFSEEAYVKTLPLQRKIVEIMGKFFNERLTEIKAAGFCADLDSNSLKWLMTRIILMESLSRYYSSAMAMVSKKYDGVEACIWGVEEYSNAPGSVLNIQPENANGDSIRCADFSANTSVWDCYYFDRSQNRVNIVLDIARGKSAGFSENDLSEIAELIKRGFVRKNGSVLSLTLPIFTYEQYQKLLAFLEYDITDITKIIRETVSIFTDILVQHAPVFMKKEAENSNPHNAFQCVLVPVKIMLDNGMLRHTAEDEHPTTYVILK